jgi:hypothetical protein
MESFHWVGLRVVGGSSRSLDAQDASHLCDQVPGELGAAIGVYLLTETEAWEDFLGQDPNHGYCCGCFDGEGLDPVGDGIPDHLEVLIAPWGLWHRSHKFQG